MDQLKFKLTQWLSSIVLGLLTTFETAISFFIPCLIAIILDVVSAYFLARRMHKKYPKECDGKFKSEHKFRVIYTMIIVFLAIILASYVDNLIFHGGDIAVRFVMGVFLFYEIWSCLENWSTENDAPLAKALQRIMISKAERHLEVPLSDILLHDSTQEHEPSSDQ